MRKKHLLVVGLVASISIISLFGCENSKNTESTTTISVVESTDETSTEETTTEDVTTEEATTEDAKVGHFDPADVCKNISINGKLVEFPWTLNKLGEEYEYGEITYGTEGDNMSASYLQYNGKRYILVNIGADNVNGDSPIVVIRFSPSDDIAVYGMGAGTTKDDVQKILGEPTEIRDDPVLDCHYVYKSDDMLFECSFYKGKLMDTYINVFGDWK